MTIKTNQFSRVLMMALIAVLCVGTAMAQRYTINHQRFAIEGPQFIKKAPISDQTYMVIDDFSITQSETKSVPVYLHSATGMWMLQFDLVLPTGITMDDIAFSDEFTAEYGNSGFVLDFAHLANGNVRVLVYNQQRTKAIVASERLHMFDITLTADANIAVSTYEMAMNRLLFVDNSSQDGQGYQGAASTCTVTIIPLATAISLDETSLEMLAGETHQLQATITPAAASQEVTWSTSDATIATVASDGTVTAVSAGEVTITATTTDGSNLTASCTITVIPLATAINLNETSLEMLVGDTHVLQATVTPANAIQAVTWSSSDATVATVAADGTVTAVAPGEVTITATTTDGTNLTASCSITVKLYGDVNEDKRVDVEDVNEVISCILERPSDWLINADVNKDGEINLFDLNEVIIVILHQ